MTSAILIIWELFGQSYSFDTPLSIVSSSLKIETGQAFALIAGLIIASAIFWSYLIGSFVDANQIILEQQKIEEQKAQMYEEKRKRIGDKSSMDLFLKFIIIAIVIFIFIGIYIS